MLESANYLYIFNVHKIPLWLPDNIQYFIEEEDQDSSGSF